MESKFKLGKSVEFSPQEEDISLATAIASHSIIDIPPNLPKMESKFFIGEPIETPLSKDNMPLANAIASLSSIEILPEPSKDAHKVMFLYFQAGFVFELMWFMKERTGLWGRGEYPFNTLECRAFESGGAVMVALFNLCAAVIDYGLIKPPHKPLTLWYRIQREQKTINFGESFFSEETKQKRLKFLRSLINQLAIWENPYKADERHMQHNFNLFNAAIAIGKPQADDNNELKKQRREFRDKTWKPLLKALRWQAQDIDKGVEIEGSIQKASFKALQIYGNSLIAVLDGKKFEVIYSPHKKNISNRGVKANITLAQ
jgi:hypothetical protein